MAFYLQNNEIQPLLPDDWPAGQLHDQSVTFHGMDPFWLGVNSQNLDFNYSETTEPTMQDSADFANPQSSISRSSEHSTDGNFLNRNDMNQKYGIDQENSKTHKSKRSKADVESAAQRRKSQVRLAQQAYRRRKEETVAYLQEDCKSLRKNITKMHTLFQHFHGSIDASGIIPPDTELATLLDYTAGQFHSLVSASSTVKSSKGSITETSSKEDELVTSRENSQLPSSLIEDAELLSEPSQNVHRKEKRIAKTPPQHNSTQDDSAQRISSGFRIHRPLIATPEPKLDLVLPFSWRLRHEAIQRGYDLINLKETPHSILSRGFRFCIFNSTRNQITKHMHHLLEESRKAIYQELMQSGSNDAPNLINDSNTTRMAIMPTKEPKILSWMENLPSSPVPCTGEPDSNTRDGITEYVDAEAVVHYLEKKGISILPGNTFATFLVDPNSLTPSTPSLFGELLSNRQLKLSTNKLIQELLRNAVCLNAGPGFRMEDVDEAVQATLLAAV